MAVPSTTPMRPAFASSTASPPSFRARSAAAMASIVDRSRNRVPFFPSQRVTSKSTTWLASMQGSGGT